MEKRLNSLLIAVYNKCIGLRTLSIRSHLAVVSCEVKQTLSNYEVTQKVKSVEEDIKLITIE